MSEWKLKERTGKDILKKIGRTAASYTPEWNFDPEHPDIGYALSVVYADMLEDTLRQTGRLGYKHQLALFNCLGADLKEAVSAGGYAVFQMSGDAPAGTGIPAYAGMTGELKGEEGPVQFETQEDLYVTPARPVCLYLTNGEQDRISCLSENLSQEFLEPLPLFRDKEENLQCHEFYLAHWEVLDIRGEAGLELRFYVREGIPLDRKLLKGMADPEAVRFTYLSEEGWQEFDRVSVLSDCLLLRKGRQQPPFQKTGPEGEETCVLRCQNLDLQKAPPFQAEEIWLRGSGSRLKPQYLYGASTEYGEGVYFPFGERPNLYEELYFGSEEALGKRGARISLRFQLGFAKIPLEAAEQTPVEWKWIMKRSDFRPDPEYDITIEEVIWEYYNGSGWSRLFPGKEYSDVFRAGSHGLEQQKTITFCCPPDMAPILVNSCDTCYIRARILKMENLYKLKGNYIAPVICEAEFSYDYEGDGKRPELIFLKDNLETQLRRSADLAEEEKGLHIFADIKEKEKILYMGFETPPVGGPIRMLWQFQERLFEEPGSISWEYYGKKGFREMNLVDETCNLSCTGLVTFVGAEDFQKCRFFDRELYWIRLRDESGYYTGRQKKIRRPVLQALYMNAARICHMEREETEYFTLDQYEEDCTFSLMRGNVSKIQVQIRKDQDEWETWEEIGNLSDAAYDAPVYEIDRVAGILRFGNGVRGRVPPFGREEGIRVHYKCGGGRGANAEAGQIQKLNQTWGFVTGVNNPQPLFGGLDPETPKEALRRCGATLRHRNRAVTARDYEELALEACRGLQKVRCFGGRNGAGEQEKGAVTLVAYTEDGRVDTEALLRYLRERMEPGILKRSQFFVVTPVIVTVQVHARVQVGSFQDIFQVKQKVKKQIRAFLNPAEGHFHGEGWRIGQFPRAVQIQNVLKEIPQIVRIEKVYLTAFVNGPEGRQEAELKTVGAHPYVLPVGGEHEVLVGVLET